MEKGSGLQDTLVTAKLRIVLVWTINSRSGFAIAAVYFLHAKHFPRTFAIAVRAVLNPRHVHSDHAETCQCWELEEDKIPLTLSILRSLSYM